MDLSRITGLRSISAHSREYEHGGSRNGGCHCGEDSSFNASLLRKNWQYSQLLEMQDHRDYERVQFAVTDNEFRIEFIDSDGSMLGQFKLIF
jgi:hypothetical protein